MHFPSSTSPCDARISESSEGARVKTDEGWTRRLKRGTTAAPPPAYPPNSVPSAAGSPLAGLECLPADLCRALGGVSTRPSARPERLLGGPGGDEAGGWPSGAERVHRRPWPALRPGEAAGGDALPSVVVL